MSQKMLVCSLLEKIPKGLSCQIFNCLIIFLGLLTNHCKSKNYKSFISNSILKRIQKINQLNYHERCAVSLSSQKYQRKANKFELTSFISAKYQQIECLMIVQSSQIFKHQSYQKIKQCQVEIIILLYNNSLHMSKKFLLLALACIFLASAINIQSESQEQCNNLDCRKTPAEFVYHNGHIITMDPKNENPEFVAVTNGKIVGVGNKSGNIRKFVGKNTSIINLHGKTLIPGLIDSHSHFSGTATRLAQGFNIAPPPFGPVTSIPMLVDAIKTYIISNNIPAGQPISGSGYSDIDMVEGRHPTRYQLDEASTVNPIIIGHFSGHIIAANSLALQLVGYQNSSSGPAGGVIDTFPNGTITGVCRQYAGLPLFTAFGLSFAKLTPAQIQAAVDQYFSSGVTTTQDLAMSIMEPTVYHSLGDSLPIDVNGYYWISSPNLTTFQDIIANYNTSRYKTRGAKFLLDGSLQGFTGLLTQPYWVPQDQYSGNLANYTYNNSRSCATESCGVDTFPAPTLLRSLFKTFISQNIDIHAHCNGDAASDHMLNAVQWARNNSNPTAVNPRIIMIHSQTVRDDQLDRFNVLGVNPSFFPVHIYFWGDKHYKIFLGPTRANRMDPTGSALRKNIRFTLHNDSPVVIAGMFNGINTFMKIISSAVNRVTAAGRVLDDGTQKISAYEALKGVTINSAWQSHEEDVKGSIEVGKVADLVILNINPLKVRPIELDSLQVLATIKGGKLVYGSYPKDSKESILKSLLDAFK